MAEIVELIPHGDIVRFFSDEKRKVVNYIKKRYRLNESEAEDCFQEGSIALWKNVKDGKLTRDNLTGSLSIYLMRCCCNHATHVLEKNMKLVPKDELFLAREVEKVNHNNEYIRIEDEQLQLLADTIQTLPEPCNTILWNVYFNYHEVEETLRKKETVMDAIALMIGYKKTSLKVKKAQCMTRLKTKLNSLLNA